MATNGGDDNPESSAVTEIEQETFSFLWTLKNYSTFSASEEYKSPVFHGGPKSHHSWQLLIHPKKKFDGQDYMSVYLKLMEFGDGDISKDRKITVRSAFCLLDAEGGYGHEKGTIPPSGSGNPSVYKKLSSWGYRKFITLKELTSEKKHLLNEDCLKIRCRVWIEGDMKHQVSDPLEEAKVKMREGQLSSDIGRLFKESLMTDLEIKCNETTYMAHKAVLAARSSVFAAMFSANMVDKSLEILDFDDDVVKGMLEYMYSGETDMMPERAPDLIKIADKYDFVGLKKDCEYAFADILNVENAAQVLVFAHLHKTSFLKALVIEYIKHNEEAVRNTKSYQELVDEHAKVFEDGLSLEPEPSKPTVEDHIEHSNEALQNSEQPASEQSPDAPKETDQPINKLLYEPTTNTYYWSNSKLS